MEVNLVTPKEIIEYNLVSAIQGARLSWASKERSDSIVTSMNFRPHASLGAEDLKLAMDLSKGPPAVGHDKFLQSIHFLVDIDMARYMWQEFDTYRVGVSKQSESTMHTINKQDFGLADFELDPEIIGYAVSIEAEKHVSEWLAKVALWKADTESNLNLRPLFKATIPESFLQKRRVSINYATMKLISVQRFDHPNKEWQLFLNHMVDALPYQELWLPH